MECVCSALGPILMKCCERRMDNLNNFRTNIHNLENEMEFLTNKKQDILGQIETEEKDGRKRTLEISAWIDQVGKLETAVKSTLEQNHTSCCSSFSRFKLSQVVVEQIQQVNRLKTPCDPPHTTDGPVKAVEQLPVPRITEQVTAGKNLAKILDYLRDDSVGIIGMVGMGGVGKTTLIKNLNNELQDFNTAQESMGEAGKPFSVVIWITVSKELKFEAIQDEIIKRLKMPKEDGEDVRSKAIRLLARLKMEKRFIVILDDVWEKIDMDKIGIPIPNNHGTPVGSKIILTTRKEDVCREMLGVIFHVATLNDTESWNLFRENAGDTIDLDEEIQHLAKAVVSECGGLPLAIITIGTALRGKTMVRLWKSALTTLRSASPDKNIEKKLFNPLKWSYDWLEGQNIKPCFLYCCLYPEDFPIEVNELIQCWVAEGLIEEQQEHEKAYDIGIGLIEKLKESCLLERGNDQGTVRMHDVVRDVAVWISSSPEEGCKSIIRSGCGLLQVPITQTWQSYRRVSFMNNEIKMLPNHVPECSQVSTLLLQGNNQLKDIPVGFFRQFSALRVLNLSATSITLLPPVEKLREVRALFLRNCLYLKQFPPLKGLVRLQLLDLSGTRMELSSKTAALKLKELNYQDHLLEFYVDLNSLPCITFENSAWLRRLRRFRIRIGSTTDAYLTPHDERVIYLCDISSYTESVLAFWSNASALVLVRCQCIAERFEVWAGYKHVNLTHLKSLTIDDCSWSGSMVSDNTPHALLFPSLEVISLRRVKTLSSISNIVVQFGRNIKVIQVTACHELKQLFLPESLDNLERLEKIHVKSCNNLVEIIVYSDEPRNPLPRLRKLELYELSKLTSICQQVMSSITHIEVKDCPLLKQLPLSASCASTRRVIKGEMAWWNKLEWDDDGDTKLNLKQYFQPW